MKMKAAIANQYGDSSVLRVGDIDKPKPKADELLVRVLCTTVNRTDEGILSGRYLMMRFFTGLTRPSSPILGTDFAGRVEQVGDAVESFEVGDDVFGFFDEGLSSHAEYLCIKHTGRVLAMPHNARHVEAVAVIEGAHYAYNMVTKVKLAKGMRVLVNGATGAIGVAAVQLLHDAGADITAVCRGQHFDLLRSLGAKRTIDYERADFREQTERYDLVIDTVIGSTYSACSHVLTSKGIYISSELGERWEHVWRAMLSPFTRGRRVIFPIPFNSKRSLIMVKELMETGRYQALIDRRYPLDDIASAYDYVRSGQKVGSVVLVVD